MAATTFTRSLESLFAFPSQYTVRVYGRYYRRSACHRRIPAPIKTFQWHLPSGGHKASNRSGGTLLCNKAPSNHASAGLPKKSFMHSKFLHRIALAGMILKRASRAFSSGQASRDGMASKTMLQLFSLVSESTELSHVCRRTSEKGSTTMSVPLRPVENLIVPLEREPHRERPRLIKPVQKMQRQRVPVRWAHARLTFGRIQRRRGLWQRLERVAVLMYFELIAGRNPQSVPTRIRHKIRRRRVHVDPNWHVNIGGPLQGEQCCMRAKPHADRRTAHRAKAHPQGREPIRRHIHRNLEVDLTGRNEQQLGGSGVDQDTHAAHFENRLRIGLAAARRLGCQMPTIQGHEQPRGQDVRTSTECANCFARENRYRLLCGLPEWTATRQ